MELRDYQKECIEIMHQHFKKHQRQLVQMPTGAGKTVTFTKYLSEYSKRSLIIVPTRELVEQVYDSALNFMHKSQLYAKTSFRMNLADHSILTAASLNYKSVSDRLLEHQVDTIIIDEAHRAQSDTYKKFLDVYLYKYPKVKIAGFTATPERTDKKPLLDLFTKQTFSRTIYDLIKQGHLCDVESYRIKTGQSFDTRRISSGDFAPVALKELNNESRNRLVYKTYQENCIGKKTLVFCVSVDHAKNMSEFFSKQGIKCHAIYGSLPANKRKAIINDFKEGVINVLFNCQLLTEGFDEPSIDALIIARPTKSKSLYCQMIGRGLRNFPGKKVCYLYELTDNVHNICMFNVAADIEDYGKVGYRNGIRLTQLKEELEGVDLSEVCLIKEKISVYLNHNPYLHENQATAMQKKRLTKKGIFFMEPLSFMEAAFILWKDKLRKRYGTD